MPTMPRLGVLILPNARRLLGGSLMAYDIEEIEEMFETGADLEDIFAALMQLEEHTGEVEDERS